MQNDTTMVHINDNLTAMVSKGRDGLIVDLA